MAMERSGNDLGALDGTLPPLPSSSPTPFSEATSWELSASSDSRTPNPRPTKITKTDSSNPPPPPASEVFADETLNPTLTPTSAAEDESKEKPTVEDDSMEDDSGDECLFLNISEEETNGRPKRYWRLKKMEDDDSDDEEGWNSVIGTVWEKVFLEPEEVNIIEDDGINVANVGDDCPAHNDKVLPPDPEACDICRGAHWHGCCPYLEEFPPGGKLFNNRNYIVCCGCGIVGFDGSCRNPYCLPWTKKKVMSRAAFNLLRKAAES